MTEVTYLGAVHGTMAALRRMVPRDRGTVVQVGSALAYRAIPLQSAYCGAKFAIRGFTDSVRTELMHEGSNVWITMVQLPAVNTPQFSWCRTKLPHHPQPVPPIYQPEVPAEAIYWAAHHRRREIDVGCSTRQGDRRQQGRARLRRLVSRPHRLQVAADRGPPVGERPDNLFEPSPKDAATHGIFDSRAKSAATSCGRPRIAALLAGLLAGATGAAVSLSRRAG